MAWRRRDAWPFRNPQGDLWNSTADWRPEEQEFAVPSSQRGRPCSRSPRIPNPTSHGNVRSGPAGPADGASWGTSRGTEGEDRILGMQEEDHAVTWISPADRRTGEEDSAATWISSAQRSPSQVENATNAKGPPINVRALTSLESPSEFAFNGFSNSCGSSSSLQWRASRGRSTVLVALENIRFTQDYVSPRFSNEDSILMLDKKDVPDLPPMRIVKYKGDLYSLDNRRLWVQKTNLDPSTKIEIEICEYEQCKQEFGYKCTTVCGGLYTTVCCPPPNTLCRENNFRIVALKEDVTAKQSFNDALVCDVQICNDLAYVFGPQAREGAAILQEKYGRREPWSPRESIAQLIKAEIASQMIHLYEEVTWEDDPRSRLSRYILGAHKFHMIRCEAQRRFPGVVSREDALECYASTLTPQYLFELWSAVQRIIDFCDPVAEVEKFLNMAWSSQDLRISLSDILNWQTKKGMSVMQQFLALSKDRYVQKFNLSSPVYGSNSKVKPEEIRKRALTMLDAFHAAGLFVVSGVSQTAPKFTCQLCYDEAVTKALVPCGHVFGSCIKRDASRQCPICRAKVESILNLRFSG